jgi:hypothetical protein
VKGFKKRVLPDGPATRGAGVSRLFNLSGQGEMSGPPVGRDLALHVAVRCMLGDDGTHSLSTD